MLVPRMRAHGRRSLRSAWFEGALSSHLKRGRGLFCRGRPDPIVSVNDALLRHVQADAHRFQARRESQLQKRLTGRAKSLHRSAALPHESYRSFRAWRSARFGSERSAPEKINVVGRVRQDAAETSAEKGAKLTIQLRSAASAFGVLPHLCGLPFVLCLLFPLLRGPRRASTTTSYRCRCSWESGDLVFQQPCLLLLAFILPRCPLSTISLVAPSFSDSIKLRAFVLISCGFSQGCASRRPPHAVAMAPGSASVDSLRQPLAPRLFLSLLLGCCRIAPTVEAECPHRRSAECARSEEQTGWPVPLRHFEGAVLSHGSQVQSATSGAHRAVPVAVGGRTQP